jgi:hypothetical protein
LSERAYEHYSCFISYDNRDQEFAERLHADLHSSDVGCWFAPEDLKTGDKIRERMNSEIHCRDKLLIILSGNSIDSELVKAQVEEALRKEGDTKRTVLFPIRLDDEVTKADAAWIKKIRDEDERLITDFQNWRDHDTYQRQFARLLRDLRAVDAQKAVEPAIAPPQAGIELTVEYRAMLGENLEKWFDIAELRDLCFDIGVQYESLKGETKPNRARELVAYCERRQIIPHLVAKCEKLRPKVSWEGQCE